MTPILTPHFQVRQNDPPPAGKDKTIERDAKKQPWLWMLWKPITPDGSHRACLACGGPFATEAEANADLLDFCECVGAAIGNAAELASLITDGKEYRRLVAESESISPDPELATENTEVKA